MHNKQNENWKAFLYYSFFYHLNMGMAWYKPLIFFVSNYNGRTWNKCCMSTLYGASLLNYDLHMSLYVIWVSFLMQFYCCLNTSLSFYHLLRIAISYFHKHCKSIYFKGYNVSKIAYLRMDWVGEHIFGFIIGFHLVSLCYGILIKVSVKYFQALWSKTFI